MSIPVLISLGVAVGAFGTLIGAGGGFILVPILLIAYPEKSPQLITGISLAIVCLNAISGSVAFGFKKRIDYKSALIFSFTTIPGSIIGSYLTSYISRELFDLLFASVLFIVSALLFIKPIKNSLAHHTLATHYIWPLLRRITDRYGIRYTYRYDVITACFLSFLVGVASSLLGIGGGIIHVPALVNILNFPVHLATATSHFMLAITGFTATAVHWLNGDLRDGVFEIMYLGVGVVFGAQAGAAFSDKVKETTIIKSLAVALALVALRIAWTRFY